MLCGVVMTQKSQAHHVAETFSDVDDDEIDSYILGQREKDFKEKQWQVLFADWLAEQEQKKLEMVSSQAMTCQLHLLR